MRTDLLNAIRTVARGEVFPDPAATTCCAATWLGECRG